ncbi:MAG: hypothetical protein HRF45_04190 [Fimbriimonadia bacterium]
MRRRERDATTSSGRGTTASIRRAGGVQGGFTLVEVVVATGLTAVALAAVVGAHSFVVTQTARVGAQAAATVTTAAALEAMRPTIEGAFSCRTVMLPSGTRALLCEMPDASAYGEPAPYRVNTAGAALYRGGEVYAFYFSDETGSVEATGNVLWRARAPAGSTSFTVDTQWSMYYGTGRPRFVCVPAGSWAWASPTEPRVRVAIESQEPVRTSVLSPRTERSEQRRIIRQFYYRNWQQ